MRTLKITFRRKYDDVNAKDEKGNIPKVPYGNAIEVVTSGPNKDTEVPCFELANDLVPETYEELQEQLENDENFKEYMDWTFNSAILDECRKYFQKLKTTATAQEQTEKGRAEVIERCQEIASRFTLSSLFAKAISSTSVTEQLNSPEMRELMKNNPAEFAARAAALLDRVK